MLRRIGILLALLVLIGCATTQEDEEVGQGVLLISNRGASNLARFEEATKLAGDLVPRALLRGQLTRLSQPGLLTYQPKERRLYVPNGGDNSILVFDNVRSIQENVPPSRILFGPGTQLSRPVHVQLDAGRDILYVANAGTNSIQVYANASTIQGGVAPIRVLSGSDTKIGSISSMWLDVEQDRLWVADPIGNQLLVFHQASVFNGNLPPNRIISGSNTRLQAPQSMLLLGKRLFVANTGSIVRFEDADALQGNLAPTAVLSGAGTALVRPQQMVLHSDKDELFVVDAAGAILVFANASTANGTPLPLRRIQGSLTGLVDPVGLVLDLNP